MKQKTGRYSSYLRPISYAIDLVIIHLVANFYFQENLPFIPYLIFVSLAWIILSLKINFYDIYRFTHGTKILSLIGKQGIIFFLIVFAFFGYFNEAQVRATTIIQYVFTALALITTFKIAIYFLLKRYRSQLGGNTRNVVIIGMNNKTQKLQQFFKNRPEYGYRLKNTFVLQGSDANTLDECFDYITNNNIDEIYSSVAQVSNEDMLKLIDFADNNLIILKFIPDNREIYSKQLDFSYYGLMPIISLRRIPINDPISKLVKRSFDIILSLLVIIGLLSWLTPILAIFITFESKGPVFFKQKRNGLDYQEFFCYKFRSMRPNPEAHLYQVKKGDERITGVGKIIRKTSIDELPQFINVLKGEMSVVGPRPHMVSHTHMYAERIDKFMVRHFIKPGITGLAQVSGYRGEVESDEDIINRVKFDIFYLENWSLLLDLKIVFQTVLNAVRGEEKAY